MSPQISSMKVRNAVASDGEKIADHNIAMALETEKKHLDRITALKGVEAVLRDASKGFYLVVEKDGYVVGQCMVTFEWSDWRGGNFWWIQSVFVEREHRNQGVFSLLFKQIVKEAKSDNEVIGLRLYVEKDNQGAQQAYERMGMYRCHYDMFEIDFAAK